MMIKTGARAATPKVETPPAVDPALSVRTPSPAEVVHAYGAAGIVGCGRQSGGAISRAGGYDGPRLLTTTVDERVTCPECQAWLTPPHSAVSDPFDSPSYADMPVPPPAKLSLPADKLTVYKELEQGTPEWFEARCGVLTASVVHQLLTAGLKVADNLTSKSLTMALVAERITNYVEPMATTRDMERGNLDEPYARDVYSERYAPATQLGFMVRDFGNYSIGYSPDGLVGDDGLLEIKSRKQKIQLATFLDDEVPTENMAQLQTGLLVSGRDWIDYMSYTGGMPPYIKRVYPSNAWFSVIHEAAAHLEIVAADMLDKYLKATEGNPPTERIDHWEEQEIF